MVEYRRLISLTCTHRHDLIAHLADGKPKHTAVRKHVTCLLCDVASCWHSSISMEEQRCLTYVRLLHKTTPLFIWCDRDLLCPQQLKISWGGRFFREFQDNIFVSVNSMRSDQILTQLLHTFSCLHCNLCCNQSLI